MYIAVDSKGREFSFSYEPRRVYVDRNDINKGGVWRLYNTSRGSSYQLESGTIKKWIGKKLTWLDRPVKISQEEINSKKSSDIPVGLINTIRKETEDLGVMFIKKTEDYAKEEFKRSDDIIHRSVAEWCKYFGLTPRKVGDRDEFPVGFYNTPDSKTISGCTCAARSIVLLGEDKYVEKLVKLAKKHYENSLIKLCERLIRKGLTDTNFRVIEKSLDVNFEMVLEHEVNNKKIITKCWTIVAEGAIQRPHYRYLVK